MIIALRDNPPGQLPIISKMCQICQIITFKMFTGIKEALIRRLSQQAYKLAVKRHVIVKIFSPNNNDIQETKSPRNLKISRMS